VFASATIEHPVPLIPNFKLSLSEVNSDAYEYTKIDYTAYYEILDNDAISIDVGLGISQFEGGKYLSQSFSGATPHAYFDAEVALPFLNTTLYTDIHYLNYDGNQITDAIAGLRYDFNLVAVDLGLKAGYRVQSFDAKDFDDLSFDLKTDGYFVGLHADF
jgi:outer membrane protein